MTKKRTTWTKTRLRSEAESRLLKVSGSGHTQLFSEDQQRHELEVHKVELEIQNEQLVEAQVALEISRDRYIDLYEFAPVGYLTLSREGIILEVNLSGTMILGDDRKKLLRRRFSPLVSIEDRDRWYQHFLHALRSDGTQNIELVLVRENGSTFNALLSCLRIPNGDDSAMRVIMTDISDQKRIEEEIRIAAIAFESQSPMIVTDVSGRILRVNSSFTYHTGYSREEALGRTTRLLHSGRHDSSFFEQIELLLKKDLSWQGEMWNQHKNGKVYAEWVSISAVTNPHGKTTHHIYTFTDINQNKEASAEIHRLAYYDPLTQLPNRRMLLDRIDQALSSSARYKRYGAILFLDLDHFKTLNDTMGHEAGDHILVEMAKRMQLTLRSTDTVSRVSSTISRLGGDEFVVLMEDLGETPDSAAIQAQKVAEKLHEALGLPYFLPTREVPLTTSIGVTLFYTHNLSAVTLLKQADLALYQAKKVGGNTVQFFDQTMQVAIDIRTTKEFYLSQALDLDQFRVYYQPLADGKGNVIGAEALLRWDHPVFGLLEPNDFIALAEDTGMILPIGKWVLETACRQIKLWEKRPAMQNMLMSVNVSARQFLHPGFLQEMKELLGTTGADPTRLMIDLKEGLAVNNLASTITVMKSLKDLGINFSLDGFGTGLSSLTYLRQLPLAQLKIDGSLIHSLTTSLSDAATVSAIIKMGKTLSLDVNAKGVETKEEMNFLETQGCNSYQGYFIGRPLPVEKFEKTFSS